MTEKFGYKANIPELRMPRPSDEYFLDSSLSYHLLYNHFPAVSLDFIDAAKQTIELANEGSWDAPIHLPNGLTLTVSEVVDGLHLDFYLDSDYEDEENWEEEDDA